MAGLLSLVVLKVQLLERVLELWLGLLSLLSPSLSLQQSKLNEIKLSS